MSLHLYDNLRVKGTFLLSNVQAQSITGLSFANAAGTGLLNIADSGYVGIGTSSALSLLHLAGSNAQLTVQNTSATPAQSSLLLRSAGQDWQVRNGGGLVLTDATAGVDRLSISTTGEAVLAGNLNIVKAGVKKEVLVGTKTLGTVASTGTMGLFSLALPGNAYCGLKLYVTLHNSSGNAVRFEEYVISAAYTPSGGTGSTPLLSVNPYQLATTPTSTPGASTVDVSATSVGTAAAATVSGTLTVPFAYGYTIAGIAPGIVSADYFVELYGSAACSITSL